MRKDTEQRLAAIERRLHPLARTIQEIIIRGGLPDRTIRRSHVLEKCDGNARRINHSRSSERER